MSVPNVGVTQLIQQPGLGNVLGQGVSGIAKMMQQIEQMKQEDARNTAYNAYMAEQVRSSQAAEAERKAAAEAAQRNASQVGGAVRDYLTPTDPTTLQIPIGIGNVSMPTTIPGGERSLQSVLAGIDPSLVPDVLKTVAPMEEQREQKRLAAQQKRALREATTGLPPNLRSIMEVIVPIREAAGTEVASAIAGELLTNNRISQADLATMRKKYPELAGLPDAALVNAVADVAMTYYKARIQAQFRPPPSGGNGGASTARTPADIRREQAALGPQITAARMAAAEAGKRPPFLTSTNRLRPYTPRTPEDSVRNEGFMADSAVARNYYNDLLRQDAALGEELRVVQGSPLAGGAPVPAAPAPDEAGLIISVDPATGRRVGTDPATGNRRFLDPPR
jgi:hypothetical protein